MNLNFVPAWLTPPDPPDAGKVPSFKRWAAEFSNQLPPPAGSDFIGTARHQLDARALFGNAALLRADHWMPPEFDRWASLCKGSGAGDSASQRSNRLLNHLRNGLRRRDCGRVIDIPRFYVGLGPLRHKGLR